MIVDGCVGRRWLELVGELLSDPITTFPAKLLGRELAASFDSDVCAYSDSTSSGQAERWALPTTFLLNQSGAGCPEGEPEDCYPALLLYRRTGSGTVTQLADMPPRFAAQWHLCGWNAFCASYAVHQQMSLPLHLGPNGHKLLVVGRSRAYSPAELRIASAIQRLLISLDRQVRVFSTWQDATGDAWPIVEGETSLTPREVTVMALVAQGLTAAAAARRLAISTRTVHKHLERAYAKLGVSDRVSAVRRAGQLGLLTDRTCEDQLPVPS